MNASAAKVVTGESGALRASAGATRPVGRDVAGESVVRGLRAVAQSVRKSGSLLNTLVDAVRGRYER